MIIIVLCKIVKISLANTNLKWAVGKSNVSTLQLNILACIFSLFYGSSKCLFLRKWRDKSINTIARANTHILLRRVQYVKCTYRGLIIHFAKVDFWRETTNCVFRNISVYYFLPCHGMDDFWKKVHTGCSTWNIVISNGCNDKISNKTLCKLDSFNFF